MHTVNSQLTKNRQEVSNTYEMVFPTANSPKSCPTSLFPVLNPSLICINIKLWKK